MSNFIPTTELDFLAYRESIKQYLKTQEAFRDYDYEGSNMAVLLDILALNTMQNAYYENMIGSEMFMDTALLKNSVVSRAKELNYTPRSRSAARTSLTISFNTGNTLPSSITIPKYYTLSASGFDANNVSKTYGFVVNNAVIVYPDSFGNYVATDVMAYQGVVVTEAFENTSNTKFILQSNTIDIDSIEVTIQNSVSDTTSHKWNRTTELYGINGTSNVYFVQANQDDKYELVFGNGVIGRKLENGNVVRVKYISTSGEDGNGLSEFQTSLAVEGYAVSSITADTETYGGSERETINSIKFQAPRFFTTQERAVTEIDFENMVRINYPQIQSVIAYGGETLDPPQYGAVAISLKPYGTTGNVSDTLKNQIINFLKTKSMTKPVIIDPEYFYVKVSTTVFYNINTIEKSLNQIKSEVANAIYNFGQQTLVDFGNDFRFSRLTSVIDDIDPSIVSNDTTLKLVKRYNPVSNSSEDIKINFGVPLREFGVSSEFDAGRGMTMKSSVFSYNIGNVNYSAFFEDDGVGNIRIVTNNFKKTIIMSNAGSINYDKGIVTLNKNLNISSYGGGYISIEVTTRARDVKVNAHRFLLLDRGDITVTTKKASAD